MVWTYLLGLMWYLRRYLRKEALDNAREILDAGRASDVQELRDADREVANVFRIIGVIFLTASIWYVWEDTLDAIKFSGNITLWDQGEDSVTILNLVFAMLIAYGGNVLHRNLRSSLDLYIFGPLDMDEGNRYAIASIARYAILFFFAAMAFKQLGFGWDKIQWLAAGLTVGLGFGMQEIFANFISGLILLTERPIRVGDVISLGSIWGEVQQINIRSTTITNWDHQEVIIPNKELITGQLTNWTLSNKEMRIIIGIGVAYHSDVEKTKAILRESALENPRVV